MKIRLVTSCDVQSIDAATAQATQIGKKGLGLLKIPSPWSIPFIAIDSSVFRDYFNAKGQKEKEELIKNVATRLGVVLEQSGISEDDTIIIRSSGVEEGMRERGLYDSKQCTTGEIKQTLKELFDGIIQDHKYLPDVAYIVQKYFEGKVLGHLSNERRFTHVKRDWVYEYSFINAKKITETESGKDKSR